MNGCTSILIDYPYLILLRKETKRGLSQLVEVELFSALARRVRMQEISQEQAKEITDRFKTHLDRSFYISLSINQSHYRLARDWIAQFNTPLRTLDALHLACASCNNIPLVTADEALAASAKTLEIKAYLLKLDN